MNDIDSAFDNGFAGTTNKLAIKIEPKKEEWNGVYINIHNARLIKTAIENGTAPFLPNEEGKIIPKPIYNANTGFCLSGKDLVPLQIERQKKGLDSNLVVTSNSISNANTRVKPEEKGMYYNYKNAKDNTYHHSMYFFPEQTDNPKNIYDTYQSKVKGFHPLMAGKEEEIMRAEDYMPLYLMACKSGVTLKVSPEVTKDFTDNFLKIIDNELVPTKEKNPEVRRMNEFFFNSDVMATKCIKNFDKSVAEAKNKMKSMERKPQEFTRDL